MEKDALRSPGARKRPPTLIYSVDEVPPWPLRLTLAFQHVLAMSVGWVYVVVAVNVIGGTPGQAQSLIRMSMIASGITTILQMGSGVVGSGYLCRVLQPDVLGSAKLCLARVENISDRVSIH